MMEEKNLETTKIDNDYGVGQIDSLDGLEAVKSCRLISTL